LRNKSTENKDQTSTKVGASTPDPSQLASANIVQTPKDGDAKTPKKDLLSEPMAATKEQRKADWAIMREMAKYLWPKVIPECYYIQ
jgi:ATP-binding cassette subfamily B (MDR/TAP) protein 7